MPGGGDSFDRSVLRLNDVVVRAKLSDAAGVVMCGVHGVPSRLPVDQLARSR